MTIAFEQVEGDFESLRGSWRLLDAPRGCRVAFAAEFDFGMPSLASMIEPIAELTLRENIEQVLEGLFGPAVYSGPEGEAGEGGAAGPSAFGGRDPSAR